MKVKKFKLSHIWRCDGRKNGNANMFSIKILQPITKSPCALKLNSISPCQKPLQSLSWQMDIFVWFHFYLFVFYFISFYLFIFCRCYAMNPLQCTFPQNYKRSETNKRERGIVSKSGRKGYKNKNKDETVKYGEMKRWVRFQSIDSISFGVAFRKLSPFLANLHGHCFVYWILFAFFFAVWLLGSFRHW